MAAANVGRRTEPQRRGIPESERRPGGWPEGGPKGGLDRRRPRTVAAHHRRRRDVGGRRTRRAREPFEIIFRRARLRLGRRDERRDFQVWANRKPSEVKLRGEWNNREKNTHRYWR